MEKVSFLKWFGAVLVLLGIVVFFSWDYAIKRYLRPALALSTTSKVYGPWSRSQPILLDIYMFNVTNPEELYEPGFKPRLQEVGPFRFREFQTKVNVTWNDNGTVSYRDLRTWYFDANSSVSLMQENITMLNLPPVIASYQARDWSYFASWGLSTSLKMLEKSIWTTRRINEFLFEGYPDPMLTLSGIFSSAQKDRVGFFYGRNNTFMKEGYFNMETGQEDGAILGRLRRWNFKNRTHVYEEGCDDVTGYLGSFFPRNYPRGKSLHFFSGDLCKAVKLDFVGEVESLGLKGHRYVPTASFMDNGHNHPETKCNCMGKCLPPGVLNVSRCLDGVPMFTSYPHFLGADPSYLEKFQGLSPDPSRSQFNIVIEPNFGFPIELRAHIQYNILLQRNPKLSMFENVPDLIFPLFWVKKTVLMTDESREAVGMLLFLPTLGMTCYIGLIMVGLLMLSVSMLPRFFKIRSHSKYRTSPMTEVSFTKSLKNEEECEKEKKLTDKQFNAQDAEKMVKLLDGKETAILT